MEYTRKHSLPHGPNQASSKRIRQENHDSFQEVKEANDSDPPWPEELHRCFIKAILENGIRHSSPAAILHFMTKRTDELTNERVKSHLQKYRKNKDKSITEFMQEYDTWLHRAIAVGTSGGTSTALAPMHALLPMLGMSQTPLGGGGAAILTYAFLCEERGYSSHNTGGMHYPTMSPQSLREGSKEYLKYVSGIEVPPPVLSEEELRHPLGAAIVQVVSIFRSMTQYLIQLRIARAEGEEPKLKTDNDNLAEVGNVNEGESDILRDKSFHSALMDNISMLSQAVVDTTGEVSGAASLSSLASVGSQVDRIDDAIQGARLNGNDEIKLSSHSSSDVQWMQNLYGFKRDQD